MKITKERRRKSEALNTEERKALKRFISSFPAMQDAADSIGVARQTLDRVKLIGTGSPETINLIRSALSVAV